MASPGTWPRRPGWKLTGGGCIASASTPRAIPDGDDELVGALVRLYTFLYGEPEAAVRPAAVYRTEAMDLSDQWVAEGCRPDSPLLAREHAALVRSYAALLAAVHH